MCKLGQTEMMVVVFWLATSTALVAAGGVTRYVGFGLLGLLALLVVRSTLDWWRHRGRAATHRPSDSEGRSGSPP